MSLQGGLSTERMCLLAGLSRAGFYRHLRTADHREEETEVRSQVQKIVLEHGGRYGYRRITSELRRRGMLVNHKRVARILREDSLLGAAQQHSFVSHKGTNQREIYLNLANRTKLTGINQVCVADITCVRLKREFVYLAVVLDRFSRRVVGWALGRTLTARLPLAALRKALAERRPESGLVHHSDRGVQYASPAYLGMLRKHGILASVSRPASPGDNASCESFLRTLKREEVIASEYEDLEDLRHHLAAFIECYYNQTRLHSALGYGPPSDSETGLLTG
jgi:putative transposase